MEGLEHILNCSICMEIFESPRQLPCQHTFCTPCLTDIISKNIKGPKKYAEIRCPLCRGEVTISQPPFDGTSFPINLTTKSIVDSEVLKMFKEWKTIAQKHEESSKNVSNHKDTSTNTSTTTASKSTQTQDIKTECNCSNGKSQDSKWQLTTVTKLLVGQMVNLFYFFLEISISYIFYNIVEKTTMCTADLERKSMTKGLSAILHLLVFSILLFGATVLFGNIAWVLFLIGVLAPRPLYSHGVTSEISFNPQMSDIYRATEKRITLLFVWIFFILCHLLISVIVCHFVVFLRYNHERMHLETIIPSDYISDNLYFTYFFSAMNYYNLMIEFYIQKMLLTCHTIAPYALPGLLVIIFIFRNFVPNPEQKIIWVDEPVSPWKRRQRRRILEIRAWQPRFIIWL